MRIAFVSPWDVTDADAWSGTIAPMYAALSRHASVTPVWTGDIPLAPADRLLERGIGRLTERTYSPHHAVLSSRRRGKTVAERVAATGADLVVAVAASTDIVYARMPQPVIQVGDTTFAALLGFYPIVDQLHPLAVRQALRVDRDARRATHSFAMMTDWAVRALLREGVPADRAHTVPFGPSVQPRTLAPREPDDELSLLLVASDWARKGGPAALAAVQQARAAGHRVSLTAVGNLPPLPDWVDARGRAPRHTLPDLYLQHDVLLELATANTAGMTLTDAAAYGLPAIATDVGGVSTIVRDGETGLLVRPGEPCVADAVGAIASLADGDRWRSLSAGARAHHEASLNWDAWATRLLELASIAVPADVGSPA
ncbi:glycosyltransferase [Allobranchiibius huperziae]|uniref:Glycosyltransferase involved in cell wall biosynthesis n=1 Tax=Allobranchiibius huperziae TaxID=1874116 RepID=A0A853DMY1_9MICO|nr:glycosyltransferase involved in cell wall biosynthesis [Allobranchiibius huperziae]